MPGPLALPYIDFSVMHIYKYIALERTIRIKRKRNEKQDRKYYKYKQGIFFIDKIHNYDKVLSIISIFVSN
ncbi:hypothetical protein JCM14467A_13870 [Vulcanisaeta sp. JCM 14467]